MDAMKSPRKPTTLQAQWLKALAELDGRKYAPAAPQLWITKAQAVPEPQAGPLADLARAGLVTFKAGGLTYAEAVIACENLARAFALPPAVPPEQLMPSPKFWQTFQARDPEGHARTLQTIAAGNAPEARRAIARTRFAALWDQFALAWGYGLLTDCPALAVPGCFTKGCQDSIGDAAVIPAAPPVGSLCYIAGHPPTMHLFGFDHLRTGDTGGRTLADHRARVRAMLLHVVGKLLPLFPAEWIKPEWRELDKYLSDAEVKRSCDAQAAFLAESDRLRETLPPEAVVEADAIAEATLAKWGEALTSSDPAERDKALAGWQAEVAESNRRYWAKWGKP
jgi:hypothetical protein